MDELSRGFRDWEPAATRPEPVGRLPKENDFVDTTERVLSKTEDNTQNSFRRVPPVFQ